MPDIIQQLLDLKEWSQNPERYERRLNFRGAGLVQPGPRMGFDKGGTAEVIKYLNTLPDNTKITKEMITDYVTKNNLKLNVQNFLNQQVVNRSPKITSKIAYETKVMPLELTDEVLTQLDNYIKNTEMNLQEIGKKIGRRLEKGGSILTKYEEIYGTIPETRFKPYSFTKESPKVKEIFKLYDEGMSKNAIAKKLGLRGPNIIEIFHKFRPEDVEGPIPKGEITSKKKSKAKARANIKLAQTKAGIKTTKQADQVINRILSQNEIYQKMSVEDIAKDKDFLKRLRVQIDVNTGEVTFDGYTKKRPVGGKVFTDLELAQHAKNRAMNYELVVPDHITPKGLRKQNVGYPINFQSATYMENSHLDNARKYLLKNPDGNWKPIDNYLSSKNLTIRGPGFKQKYGFKLPITFNSETGTSNIVELSFKKTVPKFKPKIAGDTALHSFPANIPAMWKRLGHGTKRILGWGTALLFEKVFFDWDRANEISKGKTGEEATGIALNNATFGIVPNKKYLPELKKVAEDMGIDSRAFEKVYFLNENMAKVQKEHQRYQERIESLEASEGNPEKKARAVAHMKKRYAEWQAAMTPVIAKWSEDVAGQVAISKTKLPKPSLDQIAEARYDITDVDWLKPFAEIQMVGEEKLKREKTRAYDVQSKLADPESGEKYKWITNLFTGTEDFFGLPSGVKEQRLIDDMIEKGGPGELYRYNRARGLDPDSPVTKEALENLQYEHPGLGLGFADGGLASLLKKK